MEKSIISDPLIQLTKSLVKHLILCIIYCVTNAVAVMYSRNIPMTEKRNVCFQSKKKWKYVVFLISNNYYIYLKKYFEIFVTNDIFSIFWRTTALTFYTQLLHIIMSMKSSIYWLGSRCIRVFTKAGYHSDYWRNSAASSK